jgi:FkbM family methyltransferase
MKASRTIKFVRSIIKKVPGARWIYGMFLRQRTRFRRAILGPNRGELYDIQTLDVLRRVLKADSACIDVGAHVGDILREIIAIAPHARHHAVEALPHLASRLKMEFPSVEVHACAVSDKAGEQMFNYVENAPAYSGLRQRRYDRSDPIIRQIPVSVRRIDDLIPENAPIRLIKMDIEGGEYHALLGAKKTLLRCKPFIIFEYGLGAEDFYKVTPSMMFSLLSNEVGLDLSTMERWLAGKPSYDLTMFAKSFESGDEFYYIAYPAAVA